MPQLSIKDEISLGITAFKEEKCGEARNNKLWISLCVNFWLYLKKQNINLRNIQKTSQYM